MAMDVQIVAKFSILKLFAMCGGIIAMATVCWVQLANLSPYQGDRLSPEFAKALLVSATAIFTAFLPLVAWHVWNVLSRPAALYRAGDRLFFYWAFFRSLPISEIIEVVDMGRAGPFGDVVNIRMRNHKSIVFQTTFMALRGTEVVRAIKRMTMLA